MAQSPNIARVRVVRVAGLLRSILRKLVSPVVVSIKRDGKSKNIVLIVVGIGIQAGLERKGMEVEER